VGNARVSKRRVTDSVVGTSLRDVFGEREVLQKETKKVES